MTFTVTLRPSGRTFTATPEESLLNCGLRAGIALPHGCTQGNCGECSARVLAGKLEAVGHQDFVFKGHDRRADSILLCRAAARSDLELEIQHARGVDDIPSQSLPLKLTAVQQLGQDVAALEFKVQRGRTLRFLAGQRVTLSQSDSRSVTLPIASCPCDGSVLRFYVRSDIPEDLFAPVLGHTASRVPLSKSRFDLTGPSGRFVLDESSDRALVFAAFDLGYAPINSLLEHALNLEVSQPLFLFRLSTGSENRFLHNYCRSLADAWDELTYEHLVTSSHTGVARDAFNEFGSHLLTSGPAASGSDFYIAGTEPFVAAVSGAVLEAGAVPERVATMVC